MEENIIKRLDKPYEAIRGAFRVSVPNTAAGDFAAVVCDLSEKAFDDAFRSSLTATGASVSDAVLNGCVGGQLVSSILAVGIWVE